MANAVQGLITSQDKYNHTSQRSLAYGLYTLAQAQAPMTTCAGTSRHWPPTAAQSMHTVWTWAPPRNRGHPDQPGLPKDSSLGPRPSITPRLCRLGGRMECPFRRATCLVSREGKGEPRNPPGGARQPQEDMTTVVQEGSGCSVGQAAQLNRLQD